MIEMETLDLLKKVRKIEIKSKHLTQNLFSGDYHTAFKGQGMSFAEVREYQFGDDVRSIDWNVTARTGTPHIKVFEEERELTVMLMVDVSASVFAGKGKSRHEFVSELCAVIAFSAIQNNDKVGLILFSDEIVKYIPPGKGRKKVLRIIRELLYTEAPSKETNVAEALAFFNTIHPKRCLVFLMSDYFTADFSKPLAVVSRKHQLISMHIRGAEEYFPPKEGLYFLQEPENGKQIVFDGYSAKSRSLWKSYFADHQRKLDKLFKQNKVAYLPLQTDEDFVPKLHKFFGKQTG